MFGKAPYQHLINNYASFILPHVSTNNPNESNDSITLAPSNTTPVVVSQSQNTPTQSFSSSSLSSPYTSSNNISQLKPSSTPISLSTTPNTLGVVLLHHNQKKHYVLEPYCIPINTDTEVVSTSQYVCKHTRECVINRTKIYLNGERMPHVSPTVFKPNKVKNPKFNHPIIDTRLVQCFNKGCKNTLTNLPKYFHYACYQHMIATKVEEEMKLIEYEGVGDKIVDQIVGVDNMKVIQESMGIDDHKLIFPVCGKRCYNVVMSSKNKKKPKDVSEYATIKNWNDDGNEFNRSSIKVLLDWLTTEENASSYFGGVDKKGRTNANRKEAYHHHIRDLIKKENGMLFVIYL